METTNRPLIPVLALLALALAPWAAAAPLSDADLAAAAQLRDAALQSELAYEIAASLTTEVGPRFAGSAGDREAVAWAQRTLSRLGFANVRTMAVDVPQWIRGTTELAIVAPSRQPLPAVALGGSIGTPEEGVRAEVVAVRDIEALSALPAAAVAGKIVFFTQRMERTRDGSGYGHAVRIRTQGPSAAAARGAVAAVIRSISTSTNRLPHTGGTNYDPASPRIPAVAIANPDADLLERQLATGVPVSLELKMTARELPPARSANVIGEIPGTDPDGEIVLLAAHLDSWDLGTGALDDAAGIAIVTAAARLIGEMPHKPRRTLRVVMFANEEFGLSGARAYAAQSAAEIPRHAVAMEADVGAGPVWQLESRVAGESLPAVEQIHAVLEPLGIGLGGNEASGGADISPLRERGVPVLSPRLDASQYFDHHHSANDTLDKIDPQHLAQAVAAFAVTAYLAALSEEPWTHLTTQ